MSRPLPRCQQLQIMPGTSWPECNASRPLPSDFQLLADKPGITSAAPGESVAVFKVPESWRQAGR